MLSDTPWIVILWPVLMLGVIVAAAVYKYIEVNNAKSWRPTPGKVVVSNVQRRKVKVSDADRADGGGTETRNFANVVYEYDVFGTKLRNDRVSIGEDLGNFEVEETLARYPVGMPVTVYYNPKNPKQAVIERDAPKGLWGCITGGVAVLLVGYAATLFGFGRIYDALQSVLPHAERAGFVMALSVFGLVALLIAEGIRRNVAKTRAWPVAPGTIDKAEVEEFEGWLGGNASERNRPPQTLYRSDIVYSYEVNGRTYSGTKLGSQGAVTANIRGVVEKSVARYRAGQPVEVRYDPKNPAESVIDPRMPWALWLVFLVPVGCFVGAWLAR